MNYTAILDQCTDRELCAALTESVAIVLEADRHLLAIDCAERAIAFRLAHYLQLSLLGWDVDAEYNRMGDGPKKIAWKGEPDLVLPDVIVHRRGPSGPNKLAIEIKKDTNPEPKGSDLIKLRAYRNDDNLRYEFALFIRFGTDSNAGKIMECEWV